MTDSITGIRPATHRRNTFVSLVARGSALLVLGAAGLVIAEPSAQATAATATFTYTGAEQTYSVPAGVTEVTITAVGAPGYSAGNRRGDGATVTATVPLPAGTTTLYVEVGGAGVLGPCQGVVVVVPPGGGGFNGGGGSGCGGGGGGASDVRLDSSSTTALTTTDSRLVVAGGGGGNGNQNSCAGRGGTGGDTTVTGAGGGGTGVDPCVGGQGIPGGNGGFAGSSGGNGGAGSTDFPFAGDAGALGQGGDAPTDTGDDNNFGGGGGGGYYGGGAGGDGANGGGGGGAGSSFWAADAIANSTSMAKDTTGLPEVQITPVLPDLSLADTAPASVASGRSYSYTLTATNTGGADATAVAVADTLPTGTHFVSAQSTQGSCSHTTSGASKTKSTTVNCAVGTLAVGSTATITITVTATTPGTVSDSATVTASNVTADSDDYASAPITVQGSARR